MSRPLTCRNCGEEIPPRPPSQMVTRRGEPRRFCTDACARAFRGGLYRQRCAELGLLTTSQVAEILGITEHRVGEYRKAGNLPGTEVKVDGMPRPGYGYRAADVQRFLATRIRRKTGPASAEPILAATGELGAQLAAAYCHVSYGKLMADRRAGRVAATGHQVPGIRRPVFGFKESDLDAYKRAEAARTDLWHRRNLDPEFMAKISRSRGGDGVQAAGLARARAADLAKRKGGRPRSDERAARWLQTFNEMRELADCLEERPGDLELCGSVALEDYDRHPEDWAYDPEIELDRAARRINAAVKRLPKLPANALSQNG